MHEREHLGSQRALHVTLTLPIGVEFLSIKSPPTYSSLRFLQMDKSVDQEVLSVYLKGE